MIQTSDGGEESVGVLVPENLEKIEVPILTEHQIAQVQIEMNAGFDRRHFQAEKWIGHTIAKMLGINLKLKSDNKIVSKILDQLTKDGWIVEHTTKGGNGTIKPSYVIGNKAKPYPATNFDKPLIN